MDLYLIRHADAGNRLDWDGDDDDRPLTPLGHSQAKALGGALQQHGATIEAIVTSPLVRAWQTAADIRAVVMGSGREPEFCDLLAPNVGRRRKLSKVLNSLGAGSLAIVGHDPDLPDYLSWLIGADNDGIFLEKGGAALVRFDEKVAKGDGELVWIVTPSWFMLGDPASESAAG